MNGPRASICLPTWNGARDLERLLPALARQSFEGGFEIVAIDSDSSDATRELLEKAGARVTRIEKAEFRHGATRNRIAAQAKGEILVFLSQDVVPRDEQFLRALINAFDDSRTSAAFARILPFPDDDPLTTRTVLEAFEATETPRVFEGRMMEVPFNDVASAIRASVFRALPFPDVDFGEDQVWAARALDKGHTVRFVPESVVLHAHRYTPSTAFARYKIDAAFHARVNGRKVRPSLWSVARGIGYELARDWRFVRAHGHSLGSLFRAPALRAAQVWGQYVGSRTAPIAQRASGRAS